MPVERSYGAQWLAKHWEELRDINFEWVAATGDGLVAHHPRLEVVIAEVEAGFAEEAVYALVDFDEPLDDDEPPPPPPDGLPYCEAPWSPPDKSEDEHGWEQGTEEGESLP